jgi:asparagine synthase (glutamine-hydrolysing)
MRHGLESRVPLLDDAVISFALGLPRKWLVTSRASKGLWREAFADRCLPEVIEGKKRGWITPASKWIRVGLTDWMRGLVEEAAVEHEWINAAEVYKALDEHLESRSYRLIDLWTIASYQLWWREYKQYFA